MNCSGRTPIRTAMLTASQRDRARDLIRSEVDREQRAYVVLPLVDESEKLSCDQLWMCTLN